MKNIFKLGLIALLTCVSLVASAGISGGNPSPLLIGGGTLNASPAAGFQYTGSGGQFFIRTNGVEGYFTGVATYMGAIDVSSVFTLVAANTPVITIKSTGVANATSTNLLFGTAAPTISSGFGTSPSILTSNGSTTFRINVGTGGTANTGVIGLPTAATGWNCHFDFLNPTATNMLSRTIQVSSTTNTVSVQNDLISTGAATAWPASTTLVAICFAY